MIDSQSIKESNCRFAASLCEESDTSEPCWFVYADIFPHSATDFPLMIWKVATELQRVHVSSSAEGVGGAGHDGGVCQEGEGLHANRANAKIKAKNK